jgi:hypothetical protein
MTDLVPRGQAELAPLVPARRRLSRAVQAEVDAPTIDGLVAASRVEAAAYVVGDAMARASMLGALEARLAASDPVAADRYASLVQDYMEVAHAAIRRMGVQS